MKQLLTFLILLTGIGYGQSVGLTCPTTIKAGQPLTCTVSLANTANVSAVQWTLTPSQPIGPLSVMLAGGLGGFTTATGPSGITVVFDTATVMANGTIATLSWAVPASLTCSGNATCVTVSMSGVFASSPGGTAIPLSPNPPVSLGGVNLCSISVADEKNFVINAPANTGTAATGDRNGDGLTTVVDLQIIVNAANGGPCTATQ